MYEVWIHIDSEVSMQVIIQRIHLNSFLHLIDLVVIYVPLFDIEHFESEISLLSYHVIEILFDVLMVMVDDSLKLPLLMNVI